MTKKPPEQDKYVYKINLGIPRYESPTCDEAELLRMKSILTFLGVVEPSVPVWWSYKYPQIFLLLFFNP